MKGSHSIYSVSLSLENQNETRNNKQRYILLGMANTVEMQALSYKTLLHLRVKMISGTKA
jgi:hypothetical protein